MITGSYPITRMRRRRQFPWLRDLVRETSLSPGDLIWGVIITYKKEGEPNANLPGLRRYSLTELPQLAKKPKALAYQLCHYSLILIHRPRMKQGVRHLIQII